ncbi:hypothetical protein CS542_03560 [Pedobacter sp. IW39]|nr:hypothetical protein CS542_03560 [Pedobacter sp. IW39]
MQWKNHGMQAMIRRFKTKINEKSTLRNSLLVLLLFSTAMACKTKKQLLNSGCCCVPVATARKRKTWYCSKQRISFNTLSMKESKFGHERECQQCEYHYQDSEGSENMGECNRFAGIEVARALITRMVLLRNNLQSRPLKALLVI